MLFPPRVVGKAPLGGMAAAFTSGEAPSSKNLHVSTLVIRIDFSQILMIKLSYPKFYWYISKALNISEVGFQVLAWVGGNLD